MKNLILILVVLFSFSCQSDVPSNADLSVFKIFTDHSVLQRNKDVKIWGTAQPGTSVKVNMGELRLNAKTSAEGQWSVIIPAQEAGGPHEINISAKDELIRLNDIFFGDVWLCSGQSNMEWTVDISNNAEQEMANGHHSMIRHFKINHSWNATPQDTLDQGEWQVATPETVGQFTAAGYFFAKEIQKNHDVPIGLLNSSWGGSRIEPWMRDEIIANETKAMMAEKLKLAQIQMEAVKTKLVEKLGQLPTEDVGMQGDIPVWAGDEVDDSKWFDVEVPKLWEASGFEGVDGIVWFRKEIQLSQADVNGDLTLHLAKIDDTDWTYFNGQLVGNTANYNTNRIYQVPPSALNPGKNTIAIRVEDTGGGGGIWGAAEDLFYEVNKRSISLAGSWKMQVGQINENLLDGSFAPNQQPTLLYNAMIHPIIDFPVAGVLWYQGESNAGTESEAKDYANQFKTMITDWRGIWKDKEMPFLFVQLASFGTDDGTLAIWPILRASQLSALELSNTAQASTMDIGNPVDIHPKNKQEVGRRLALAARAIYYGEKDLMYKGPSFIKASSKENGILIEFENVGEKLQARNGEKEIMGFQVAGKDGVFKNADAQIVDSSIILVNAKNNMRPDWIRYAWKNSDMAANLENSEGLPAIPFETKIGE